MKPKALIVEDDDLIIESIEDTLFSIGHDHAWATNQHDARQMLRDEDYSYVLLDLQIPAKPNRGGADTEFGCNLLADIQRIKGRGTLPIIVMTAYSSDCLDLTTELYANGASDFIAKPFSNRGRTLASVIRKVVSSSESATLGDGRDREPVCAGFDLVFYADRVELAGVKIITDRGTGQCFRVMEQLRRKDSHGRFVRMSAEELAIAIEATGGVGTITGCIQTLRRNIVTRLGKAGIEVGREDVIERDERGYGLREGVVIGDIHLLGKAGRSFT